MLSKIVMPVIITYVLAASGNSGRRVQQAQTVNNLRSGMLEPMQFTNEHTKLQCRAIAFGGFRLELNGGYLRAATSHSWMRGPLC